MGLNALLRFATQGRSQAAALGNSLLARIPSHVTTLSRHPSTPYIDPLDPLPTGGPSVSVGLAGLGPSLSPSARHGSSEESLLRYRFGFYHPVRLGDTFKDGRYVIRRKLGWGGFSTVWLAFDKLRSKYVSMKIVLAGASSKKIDSDGTLSRTTPEIDILQKLQEQTAVSSSAMARGGGHPHLLQLIDYFQFDGPNGTHDCVVTEVLGQSLHSVLAQNDRKLPPNVVKRVIRQLLSGLEFVHATGVVHTDIKPDNLLLSVANPNSIIEQAFATTQPQIVSTDRGSRVIRYVSQPLSILVNDISKINVKLVDFGVANWAHKPYMKTVQPRCFRAPEVILGAKWGTSADIWNVGCLIPELLTGRNLFNPDEAAMDETHLAQMIELLGEFPRDVITSGTRGDEFFNQKGNLRRVILSDPVSIEQLASIWLSDLLPKDDLYQFCSFIRSMLRIRPSDRATATQLLSHPWLSQSTNDSS